MNHMSKKRKEWEPKEIVFSRHHILPRHPYGSNESINVEVIRDTIHRSIHNLFWNKMIAEQLITTVNLSEKALREDVRQWLIETLTSRNIYDPFEWYDPRAIDPNK